MKKLAFPNVWVVFISAVIFRLGWETGGLIDKWVTQLFHSFGG